MSHVSTNVAYENHQTAGMCDNSSSSRGRGQIQRGRARG